jgi:hypothetical protein
MYNRIQVSIKCNLITRNCVASKKLEGFGGACWAAPSWTPSTVEQIQLPHRTIGTFSHQPNQAKASPRQFSSNLTTLWYSCPLSLSLPSLYARLYMTDINTKCTETNLGPDLAVGAHTFTPADGGWGWRSGGGRMVQKWHRFSTHLKQSLRKITINEDDTVQAYLIMTTKSIYSHLQQKLFYFSGKIYFVRIRADRK